MAKALHKMSLDSLRQMRSDVVAAHGAEDGKMTIGEYLSTYGETKTLRAENAAMLAQLDQAIASLEATGSETTT